MGKMIEEFNAYRTKMNDRIMETADTNIKRFMALDTTTYAEGALDVKTKEIKLPHQHNKRILLQDKVSHRLLQSKNQFAKLLKNITIKSNN